MVCSGRPYPFKFFKGCLPQILLGSLLNSLSRLYFNRVHQMLSTTKSQLSVVRSLKFPNIWIK